MQVPARRARRRRGPRPGSTSTVAVGCRGRAGRQTRDGRGAGVARRRPRCTTSASARRSDRLGLPRSNWPSHSSDIGRPPIDSRTSALRGSPRATSSAPRGGTSSGSPPGRGRAAGRGRRGSGPPSARRRTRRPGPPRRCRPGGRGAGRAAGAARPSPGPPRRARRGSPAGCRGAAEPGVRLDLGRRPAGRPVRGSRARSAAPRRRATRGARGRVPGLAGPAAQVDPAEADRPRCPGRRTTTARCRSARGSPGRRGGRRP